MGAEGILLVETHTHIRLNRNVSHGCDAGFTTKSYLAKW